MPVPLDLEQKYRTITLDALRPLSLGIALLFGVFIVFNLIDLPRPAVWPVVVHDAGLVILATILHLYARRDRIPETWAHPLSMVMALFVLSNVLLTFWLLKQPFYTNYVAIIVIAAGSLILSTRWLLATTLPTLGAWGAIAATATTPKEFAHYGFTLVAAAMVCVAIHQARRRSYRRLAQLRFRDEERKLALQHALDAAEAARAELDSRVKARTADLERAYDELQSEFQERRHVEEKRIELEQHLQHSQKMDSVGRLAGGVAHDFNNLLTVISGNLQRAQLRTGTDEQLAEILDEASQATDRAAAVTRQLLAFSRKQIMRPQVTHWRFVLDGIHKMLERIAGERVELKIAAGETTSNIRADVGQLEQVIVNLAINACDAMRSRGSLTITMSDVRLTAAECADHPHRHPGVYARLIVADDGEGMDEQTCASIFEPFFTTKDVGKGTGLGLAVVDGIISQHGGFIELTSEPGQGSAFSIYLPTTDHPASAVPKTITGKFKILTGTETILLVEDEPAVRKLAVDVLKSLGYSVLAAEGGQDALELARRHDGEIHLLITDVLMRGMDGRQLTDALAESHPAITVLYTSGHSGDRIAHHGILDEGVNFLPKPYSVEGLSRRVRELLDQQKEAPKPRSRPKADPFLQP
ncbi:MAG: ATP-binding protein [bacterium]